MAPIQQHNTSDTERDHIYSTRKRTSIGVTCFQALACAK